MPLRRIAPAVVVLVFALPAFALRATPTAAGVASDEETARAGVIVASDLPPGWEGTETTGTTAQLGERQADGVRECRDYRAFTRANRRTPNAASPDFTLGGQELSNRTFVYPRTAGAKRAMTTFRRRDVANCLSTVFGEILDAQLASEPDRLAQVARASVTVDRVGDVPRFADATVGYAGTIQVVLVDGSVQQLVVGVLVVRVGRVVISYTFAAPPDAEEITAALDGAIAATIGRTEDALG